MFNFFHKKNKENQDKIADSKDKPGSFGDGSSNFNNSKPPGFDSGFSDVPNKEPQTQDLPKQNFDNVPESVQNKTNPDNVVNQGVGKNSSFSESENQEGAKFEIPDFSEEDLNFDLDSEESVKTDYEEPDNQITLPPVENKEDVVEDSVKDPVEDSNKDSAEDSVKESKQDSEVQDSPSEDFSEQSSEESQSPEVESDFSKPVEENDSNQSGYSEDEQKHIDVSNFSDDSEYSDSFNSSVEEDDLPSFDEDFDSSSDDFSEVKEESKDIPSFSKVDSSSLNSKFISKDIYKNIIFYFLEVEEDKSINVGFDDFIKKEISLKKQNVDFVGDIEFIKNNLIKIDKKIFGQEGE